MHVITNSVNAKRIPNQSRTNHSKHFKNDGNSGYGRNANSILLEIFKSSNACYQISETLMECGRLTIEKMTFLQFKTKYL